MRSLLSQFQAPAFSRKLAGFFGPGGPFGSPRRTDHPAYFGLATI